MDNLKAMVAGSVWALTVNHLIKALPTAEMLAISGVVAILWAFATVIAVDAIIELALFFKKRK